MLNAADMLIQQVFKVEAAAWMYMHNRSFENVGRYSVSADLWRRGTRLKTLAQILGICMYSP